MGDLFSGLFNPYTTGPENGDTDNGDKHKAPGLEGIPADALKTPRVIPSKWTKSIINPIPKAGSKDSRIHHRPGGSV